VNLDPALRGLRPTLRAGIDRKGTPEVRYYTPVDTGRLIRKIEPNEAPDRLGFIRDQYQQRDKCCQDSEQRKQNRATESNQGG
jgi:hypothetical protein